MKTSKSSFATETLLFNCRKSTFREQPFCHSRFASNVVANKPCLGKSSFDPQVLRRKINTIQISMWLKIARIDCNSCGEKYRAIWYYAKMHRISFSLLVLQPMEYWWCQYTAEATLVFVIRLLALHLTCGSKLHFPRHGLFATTLLANRE